jgi:hypothetical protein
VHEDFLITLYMYHIWLAVGDEFPALRLYQSVFIGGRIQDREMFSSLHRRLVAVGIFYAEVARRGNGQTEHHEGKTESWMSLPNIFRSFRGKRQLQLALPFD